MKYENKEKFCDKKFNRIRRRQNNLRIKYLQWKPEQTTQKKVLKIY